MKMKTVCAVIIAATTLFTAQAMASGKTHWAYSGDDGPDNWGSLDASFSACASGKNQSPVNLTRMVEGNLPELKTAYKLGGGEVINNGHTIQVNYTPGSSMSVAGQSFELKQFHFHSPSENTIEGTSYPMEAHFVHADKDGNLAVIALMFKEGKANVELEKAWAQMPQKAGEKQPLTSTVDATVLLPGDYDYYRFSGSLTTPPCSEGVNWFVMKAIATASKEQLVKFTATIGEDNNRPVQPLNARIVIQ